MIKIFISIIEISPIITLEIQKVQEIIFSEISESTSFNSKLKSTITKCFSVINTNITSNTEISKHKN